MLSINFGIETADNCNTHYNDIKDWLIKRIDKKTIAKSVKSKLKLDLKDIITSEPNKLMKLNKDYLVTFPRKKNKKGKWVNDSRISYIFNYTAFRKKFGFILSQSLRVNCCPYCNKNYTSTLFIKRLNEKNVFPEFDHFYPQSSFPFLSLSFYNLIPSCNVCNTHFKSNKDSTKIFHPYTKVNPNHFTFKNFPNDVASLYGSGKNIDLDFAYNSSATINKKVKASIDFFGIKEIYEVCHTDIIQNIIHKKIAFSERYIEELKNTYKIPFEDAYQILFETHHEDEMLHKRPFSKLKKDIFEDVNIKSV